MKEELKCKVLDKNKLEDLKYVVVCSLYNDKLLLSRHKQRDTWGKLGEVILNMEKHRFKQQNENFTKKAE